MGVKDLVSQLLLKGYTSTELTFGTIAFCVLCTALLALYIFTVYKKIRKEAFYNRNFNLSVLALAIITAAIILTIQSNIVVSLGMVGALSIIRFRTAVKDPLDLVFMFWSISVGIICGAGYIVIAALTSFVLTIILIWVINSPISKQAIILVINASTYEVEDELITNINKYCKKMRVRAKNMTKTSLNMAIEVDTENEKELMKELVEMENIISVSIVENDGDATLN